jgi:hypothetical protein
MIDPKPTDLTLKEMVLAYLKKYERDAESVETQELRRKIKEKLDEPNLRGPTHR